MAPTRTRRPRTEAQTAGTSMESNRMKQATIVHLEDDDDNDADVAVTSPSVFQQAKANARQRRTSSTAAAGIDVDMSLSSPGPSGVRLAGAESSRHMSTRQGSAAPGVSTSGTRSRVTDLTSAFESEDCVILQGAPPSALAHKSKRRRFIAPTPYPTPFMPVQRVEPPQADAELKITCSICLETMKEEASTVCGHLFCRGCILDAVKAQKKCPTCRKKLAASQVHRIYLSSTAP